MRDALLYAVIAVLSSSGLPAHAGDITGKIAGWRPAGSGSLRRGVVWLEGGQELLAVPTKKRPPAVMSQIKGRFVPSFLVVTAGQIVDMPNEDDIAHNVYSDSPAKTFDLGFYARGTPRSVVFDAPGVVQVACSIHHLMRATVVVVPNSYYALVNDDGTFRLRNTPKGKYSLKLWGEGLATSGLQVNVPGTGTLRVQLPAASSAPVGP